MKIFIDQLQRIIWVKVFKNGPSKICGKQPLKKFEVIWSAKVFLELQYLVYDLIDFFKSMMFINASLP